jgi:conjugal transfer pilus assembly protein TraB
MNLNQKWAALDPGRKKKYMILFGIIALFSFAYLASSMTSKKGLNRPKDDSVEVEVMVPKRRDATLEELSAQQMASTRKISRLENQLQSTQKILENRIQELISQLNMGQQAAIDREVKNDMEYLMNRLKRLESQLSKQAASLDSDKMRTPAARKHKKIEIPTEISGEGNSEKQQIEIPNFDTPSQLQPPSEGADFDQLATSDEEPQPRLRHPLRVVSGGSQFTFSTATDGVSQQPGSPGQPNSGASVSPGTSGQASPGPRNNLPSGRGGITEREARDLAKIDDKPKDVYLPSGSMFQGILLNGLDAVTSNANRRNQTPVLIRVKHDAILPNYYSLQIRECFVTAGGYGDMSTERAMMRTERISCVRDDGGVIDAPLDGYIIGEDGKVGMRGRLVMRQGDMLARAAFAGLLSGFAQALEPQGLTGITINADGGSSSPATRYSTGDVMAAGLYGGLSSASEKVADFYLDLVDQMKPTIEVDAGRKATVVVVKGTNLKLG